MFIADTNLIILEWTTRWLLAILFFFQAYDRIFRIGLKETTNIIYYQNTEQKFPYVLVQIGVFINSFAELIAAVLLFFGLFRNVALYILCIDMLLAAFGFSYLKPMWDMKHFFPRFVLLCIQLFLPSSTYVIALEHYF